MFRPRPALQTLIDAELAQIPRPFDRDRFDETRSMVVDLGVLAKADAFVGSLWSNVGRLSYELSAADKGCLPPLISRDVGWCSVDGQLQDGTVYGHLNC